jgi:hypothetical protein
VFPPRRATSHRLWLGQRVVLQLNGVFATRAILEIALALAAHSAMAAAQKTPEQACQAQALASIARECPGGANILAKDRRCFVFLQAPSAMFPGKRAAWLIDGKTGEMLSEFYAPAGDGWTRDSRGICTYRGGALPYGRMRLG